MSTTTTEAAEAEPVSTELPREYHFSVLVTGFARMWRGAAPAIIVVLANAIIQALLVLPDPVIGEGGIWVYVLAAASGIVIVVAAALITAIALQSVHGKVSINDAISLATKNFWLFAAWLVGLWIVATVGYLIFTIPGMIILAVTPFVTVAAIDGQGNALMADLKALSARPIRWAVTIIITGGIIGFILWLMSAIMTFFITGAVSAFIIVTIIGWFGWWLQTSWACLYRSTPVGVTDAPQEDAV